MPQLGCSPAKTKQHHTYAHRRGEPYLLTKPEGSKQVSKRKSTSASIGVGTGRDKGGRFYLNLVPHNSG